MARSARATKHVSVAAAAADSDAVYSADGTIEAVTYVGGAGAKVTLYEGATVAGGEVLCVLQSLSTTVPGAWAFPRGLPFEGALSVKVEGTLTTTISIVIG